MASIDAGEKSVVGIILETKIAFLVDTMCGFVLDNYQR